MALRLWQKIYLSVFSLMAVLLAVLSILWQKNTFHTMLDLEQTSAATEHSFIINTLQNLVLTEQLRSGKSLLDEEALSRIVTLTLKNRINQDCAIFFDTTCIASNHADTDLKKQAYAKLVDSGYILNINRENDRYFCYVTSQFTLQKATYTLVSVRDLTPLYTFLETSNRQLFYIYAFGASGIALFLFIMIHFLLKPLQKMNHNVTAIASGNYGIRLSDRRRDELGDMAANMNQMASAIEQNINELQQVADDRKKFIDNLSHEMKTPLTSILGYADLLTMVEDLDPATRVTYANVILSESKRLRTLSDKLMELITIGKISSQEMHMLPVAPLIQELELSVKPLLAQKHLELVTLVEPFYLFADKALLQSMLYNFIDNARKASAPNSRILLQAAIKHGYPVLAVTDYGIGISPEEIVHITKPFYMVDKSRSRAEGGAGLGLTLCQEIAELHHAKLHIHSTLGKGTCIFVIFQPVSTERRSASNGKANTKKKSNR